MNASEHDESWAYGCADLPVRCRMFAQQASDLLRSVVALEADSLALEGFLVPARDALFHAADVFGNLAVLDGGAPWTQRPNPIASINLVCAVVGSEQSFENEWDLDAMSSWWTWRDAQEALLLQARGAQQMVNAGKLDRVVQLLNIDIDRAEREMGANR